MSKFSKVTAIPMTYPVCLYKNICIMKHSTLTWAEETLSFTDLEHKVLEQGQDKIMFDRRLYFDIDSCRTLLYSILTHFKHCSSRNNIEL